jgi:hypothetical protein
MSKFDDLYERVMNEKFSDLNPKKGKVVKVSKATMAKDDELKDEIYNLIDFSYANIGGHLKIRSPEDIPGDHEIWDVVDVSGDGEPDAVLGGKKKGKYDKYTLTATDGSKDAKGKMLNTLLADLKKPGNVIEISDALAHVMITRYDVPIIDDSDLVQTILKKDIDWVGPNPNGKYPNHNGWYERKIGGKLKLKILAGTKK